MSRVQYQRIGRGVDANVVEIYPSESGGRLSRSGGDPRAPAEDAEPRAINCFQCGQPIEDYAAISECPFCESDNFLGLPL